METALLLRIGPLNAKIQYMVRAPFYHVDSFTGRLFSGNPAAVVLLDSWPADETLQRVAAEINLPETAFVVEEKEAVRLRWFTPVMEVDLCGHGTLAAAHVWFTQCRPYAIEVAFETRSGSLTVRRSVDLLVMDFPSRPAVPVSPPAELAAALGVAPREVLKARDYLCVFDDETVVRRLQPNMERLARLEALGTIVTAAAQEADFISRFFAPRAGVPEDQVTGSSHCTLVPYWSKRLGKKELLAHQVSPRGGELFCTDRGDRTLIAGHAVLFAEGSIRLP